MASARGKQAAPEKRRAKTAPDERSKVHGPRVKSARQPGSPTAKSPEKKPRAGAPGARQRARGKSPPVMGTSSPSGPDPGLLRSPPTTGSRATPNLLRSPLHASPRAPVAFEELHAEAAASGPKPRPAADAAHAFSPSTDGGRETEGAGSGASPRALAEASTRVMELHWGDDAPRSRKPETLVERWVKRGDALLRHLAEHGAARHEYRADLKEGRFVWVDAEGRVSAEAQAQVLCSWSRSTSALAMAWADPLVRGAAVPRVEGMPAERDDVDEESAWRIAMETAERSRAEYLYRVSTPHAWYFLALSGLTFHPDRATWSPSTPVGLVLRGLAETRRAIESRAEPTEIVRSRLSGLGRALLVESEYAYRGTDWVARLERSGRRLVQLADKLPRSSFGSVAAGRLASDWLGREVTIDLSDALALLEDEWTLFV